MQAPAPGKADNVARGRAGGGWAGEQLCGRRWCPGAPSSMQELAVPSQQDHGPSFKGWDCPLLLSAHEAMARDSVWFWAPVNTRRGQTGASSARAPSQAGLEQLPCQEGLRGRLAQSGTETVLGGCWQQSEALLQTVETGKFPQVSED